MKNELMKKQVESLFNIANASMEETKNLAALITAASMMAICSDITVKDTTIRVLLDIYQKNDDEEVKACIGMEPEWVSKRLDIM